MTCDGTAFVRIRGRGACHGRSGAGTSGSGSFLGKAVCRAVSVHCMAGAGCTPAGSVCGAAACARASAAAAGAARLAAGYGAGRGNTGSRRAPGPGCGDGGKRSVRTAGIRQKYGTGNKGSLWNGTGGAAGSGCRRAVCTGGRADGGFRSITQNSRSPLRRDPSSSAGAAGRLCVASGRGRMCAVAPCALCGMARPHVPLEPADGKLCGAKGSRRGLPGGAYAPRTGDICQCRRAVPYGRGRAASGGAGPGGPV